jgi:hypothetical protein
MGLLQAYYDKQTAVEYFCVEDKHTQENSYWMTKVRISVWDVEKGVHPLWLNWAALWATVAVAQLGRPKRGVRAGLQERRGKECKQAGQ